MSTLPEFVIEKALFGFRVVATPDPGRLVRASFRRAGNKGFSEAVGYAVRWAAEANGKLIDRTGRLSDSECAELVVAMRTRAP
ncbi:hypothetical protein CHH26_11605 [Qipengyuania flava]|uniref:hypothetical protein n=1 Tax=Qipengyuania flava TaxID=192812 RepID=UPI000B8BD88C|nr:hypothetical protein [Qipengyuania flava]ASP30802.1 hypothetical protein CHH26_11605 [Qipengyuania flava]